VKVKEEVEEISKRRDVIYQEDTIQIQAVSSSISWIFSDDTNSLFIGSNLTLLKIKAETELNKISQ
jgi:ligand-binding sensor domain-containing protein